MKKCLALFLVIASMLAWAEHTPKMHVHESSKEIRVGDSVKIISGKDDVHSVDSNKIKAYTVKSISKDGKLTLEPAATTAAFKTRKTPGVYVTE